jgi:hypothetical protein
VAVHILEGIGPGISYRHQFDHTDVRVIGNAGALVEIVPAQEILLDVRSDTGDAFGDALAVDDFSHALSAQKQCGDTSDGIFPEARDSKTRA